MNGQHCPGMSGGSGSTSGSTTPSGV
jgi:hypothetical protein